MGKSRLVLAAIAVLGAALAFIITWESLAPGKKADAELEELPFLPGHEETRYVGSSIPEEERGEAPAKDAATQGTSHGELNWQRKPAKKEEKPPVKADSSYDKDRDVVKPDAPGGDAVR
jgi:hypothetical protein